MSCSICLDSLFSGNAGPACLPCGHSFHLACLRNWFGSPRKRTCPQCRQHTTEQDLRLLYFNESPESRELENKLNELSRNMQVENVALQAVTGNIQQLSQQVLAHIKENAIASRTAYQKNTEMMEKIYTHVTKNDRAIKILTENCSSAAESSLSQKNQEKLLKGTVKNWYFPIYPTLAIFCILLFCLALFWTLNEFSKPESKSTPLELLFLHPTNCHFVKIRQPSLLNSSVFTQTIVEIQCTKSAPIGLLKSIMAAVTDSVQQTIMKIYNNT